MRKMRKFHVKTLLWWLVSLSLTAGAAFSVYGNFSKSKAEEKAVCLRLWQVDSFEGGKGSRGAFLKRVANEFYKESGVTVIVSTLTQYGAKTAFEKGETPDLFSFGLGADYAADYAYSLGLSSTSDDRAVVWCKGGYAIFSRTDEFSKMTEKNTLLSKGGNNLPSVAVALLGQKGNFKIEDSTTAYVKFLNGNCDYLIGTQRDICRFSSRGVEVYCKPLGEYLDLNQYVSVTSGENMQSALSFVRFLLREETQRKLTSIGMLSSLFKIYDSGEKQSEMEKVTPSYTLSPFYGEEALDEIQAVAKEALRSGEAEPLKKILKSEG